MRPPRDARPPVARPLRTAAPGRRPGYVVHPGALAPQVHEGLAAALPAGDGLTVLDLGAVPDYADAALTGGRAATTVEALAERLLATLEPAPEGPYTLAGWSFGGVLALAMTHALPADRRPGRLVLLDSIAPTEAYQQPDDALEPDLLLGWFAMYLGAKRGRPVPLAPGALEGRVDVELRQLPLALGLERAGQLERDRALQLRVRAAADVDVQRQVQLPGLHLVLAGERLGQQVVDAGGLVDRGALVTAAAAARDEQRRKGREYEQE